jgi:hypothetical protein
MLVLFRDNYEVVIKGTATLKLGDMLCELLNLDIAELRDNGVTLATILHSLDPTGDQNFDKTVKQYTNAINRSMAEIRLYQEHMKTLPFYRFSREVDDTFMLFDTFTDSMVSQMKHREPDIPIVDAELSVDMNLFKTSIKDISLLFTVMIQTYAVIKPIVDECLLYYAVNGQTPIRRLYMYGLDKFNDQVIPKVKGTDKKSVPSMALTYDIIGDGDDLSLEQCYDFESLLQYIYHEFMKLIIINADIPFYSINLG